MEEEKKEISVTLTYPHSDEFEFLSKIDIIDLDAEKDNDIATGNGFLITESKGTNKKDMKNINGIYSSRFGQRLSDVNPYADRYSCDCGYLKSRINHSLECPMCHTKCRYIDDDFKKFGWIVLKDEYHIIQPKFYDSLDYIFGESKYGPGPDRKKVQKGGRKLINILCYDPDVDQDGKRSETSFKPPKEPFYGIGMMEFYERFDEILDYYYALNPKKKPYYDEIQQYRNLVFCHSIPVYTTHLRPADIRDGYMYFEPTNGMYNMINRHVHKINKNKRKMDNDIKIKNSELYKVQMKYMELVREVMNILNGKRGQLRSLFSGRYNFSCRAVIRQDATLRVDQIKLPYVELVKCLQQPIINILVRNYNITPSEAYDKWYRAIAKKDDRIAEIIDNLIHAKPEGLPVLINRNPTMVHQLCITY